MAAVVEWFDRQLYRLAFALTIVVNDIVRWATEVKPGTEEEA